jgi:hypothetical protein
MYLFVWLYGWNKLKGQFCRETTYSSTGQCLCNLLGEAITHSHGKDVLAVGEGLRKQTTAAVRFIHYRDRGIDPSKLAVGSAEAFQWRTAAYHHWRYGYRYADHRVTGVLPGDFIYRNPVLIWNGVIQKIAALSYPFFFFYLYSTPMGMTMILMPGISIAYSNSLTSSSPSSRNTR